MADDGRDNAGRDAEDAMIVEEKKLFGEMLNLLRRGQQCAYCYEQTLLSQCNEGAAKIYTQLYEDFGHVIKRAEEIK